MEKKKKLVQMTVQTRSMSRDCAQVSMTSNENVNDLNANFAVIEIGIGDDHPIMALRRNGKKKKTNVFEVTEREKLKRKINACVKCSRAGYRSNLIYVCEEREKERKICVDLICSFGLSSFVWTGRQND